MQPTNKILCNMAQTLSDAEKYQGRTNIGTFGLYSIQPTSTTHTIDQTESGNGYFSFTKGATASGLYLLSLHLYIAPDGTHPSDNVIPLHISVTRHYSGGGTNAEVGYTADLTQLAQNGPWETRLDLFQTIENIGITSFDFTFQFEANKIPQGTPINCYATGVLIGNIEPTP
jgi:hypothetical protein